MKKAGFSVFPNPSEGKIEINVPGTTLKEFKTNLTLMEIDLSELPSGTYYLNIENSDGKQVIKPIQFSGRR